MGQNARHYIAALRRSHDLLVGHAGELSDDQLSTPSYCRDWDVSQVLSHLGSGAEISLLTLEHVLDNAPPLEQEDRLSIWARWDSSSARQRQRQMVVWDRRSVYLLEGLSDEALAGLHTSMHGMELDAAAMVGLRLGEHAVHTWDLLVTFDPEAELLPEAAELMLGRLGWVAGRTAKTGSLSKPRRVAVDTGDAQLLLTLAEAVSLQRVDQSGLGAVDAHLVLAPAALVRLVYGRLDQAHTPAGVKVDGDITLDELRAVFPGF